MSSDGSGSVYDIEFRAVTKRFGDLTAVNAVSFQVRKGEFLSLLGPSGCGKTTSLRMIAGFEQPDEGEILIGGVDAVGTPPYRRDVNTVFQQYALFPHMSILDNVAYGLKQKGVGKSERYARAREALELVQLTGRDKHRPTMLSGGQQQRVALARALVNQPARPAARRAARRARPQAPQGDADRAHPHPGAGRDHLHLRHPRPGRGAVDVRPDRGHVQRRDRAARHARARSTTGR